MSKMIYHPLVSIVIPAYNASNYLAEAIDSAVKQTYSNVEIIVVNDGSHDNGATRAIAEKYGDKIRYFEKENGGSSSALNTGIKNMKGEWFSWLSHDDLYMPEKIKAQINFLNEYHQNGYENIVLFCGSEAVNENGKVIRAYNEKADKEKAKLINSWKNNNWLIADQIKKYSFHGCGCLVHKSVFEKIGYFDERLRLLNDVDFWLRIFLAGYTVRYVPKCLVQGRIHSKQVSKSIGYSYHNAEQDRYWKQVLDYLLSQKNVLDWEELMLSYASTATEKTRWDDGHRAFKTLSNYFPQKRIYYFFEEVRALTYGAIRTCMKKIYIVLILNCGE